MMALPSSPQPATAKQAITLVPSSGEPQQHPLRPRGAAIEASALAALVALAAVLRLLHLATNPGWDGDEGYNYNIALNLAHGRHQMFALDFAFVQHPPLFFALTAALFRVVGPSMLAMRLLSVLFSLGTLALLPALGRAVGAACEQDARASKPSNHATLGRRIGWLAAFAYAVWPFAALQNRFGYTYNGLAFWTILALLALLRYRHTRRLCTLIVAALACAAALMTDQEGLYLLPVLLLGLSGASLRARLGALVLALSGSALYLGVMAVGDGATLLFDITHTAGRVSGGSPAFQIEAWLYNFADLMRIDPLIPLGLTGLALIPERRTQRLLLGLLTAMLLVILKVRDPNPLFRTAEPLLPLVCLGLGVSAARLWTWLDAHLARRTQGMRVALATLMAALLLVPTVAIAASDDIHLAMTRFPTPIDGLLPRSTAEAARLAAWINGCARPSDVVLSMPQVSWLLHARTAELLQAVAITGRSSAFYPAGLARRRWIYDVHLDAARFLVVDDFTHAWIAADGSARALVARAAHTWRLAYAHGEYHVYENPARATACAGSR